MEKEKAKLEELEESLEKEEKVLEGIRDSLKGTFPTASLQHTFLTRDIPYEDKTQVFHDQIEAKQKELQPWTAQINAKQAEIDVAVSERDTLAQKVEAVQNARKDAVEALEKLQADHEAKATDLHVLSMIQIMTTFFICRLWRKSNCARAKATSKRN